MKVKVSKLTPIQLDWLVAKCEGFTDLRINPHKYDNGWVITPPGKKLGPVYLSDYRYSSNWVLGGPIIQRAGISIMLRYGSLSPNYIWDIWDAVIKPEFYSSGRPESGVKREIVFTCITPLTAAMKCYIVSKLGDEVEFPEELVGELK